MPTLAGRNTRTITGYVITLLDYPRWVIEREVDFTHCHLSGEFDMNDAQCSACHFGAACCWLNSNRTDVPPDAPLDELLQALKAAVEFIRSQSAKEPSHSHDCECDSCQWLREAKSFLRLHRHKA
jgi:hypothetical protein